MATIDDKVVAMSFESSKFEQGVDKTISSLDKLKAALKFPNAGKGLDDINASAKNVDLSHIASAVDSIKGKFSALSVAALSIFANIANKAVSAAASLVKSFTIEPVLAGLREYETNLNSIQTVLANTQAAGTTLTDVNKALQDLNHYSDKTIYNFTQMAQNIGTFTAAGVGLNQATQSIKGIANLAALSGSNSQQASTAMYQLSQAIAAGSVKLQDWNSVVNAGMGGEVFQKALFDTGKAMGTLTGVPVGQTFEEWKKAGNSFRASLSGVAKQATSNTSAIAQAQKDAAKTVAAAEQSQADAVASAAKTVQEAQAGVADSAKQAAADVTAATQAQSDTIKKSAEDVKAALQGVRDARKRLAEAMKPPSKDELQAAADNLQSAQLDQADLSDAIAQAQQEQTRSTQDLAAAQKKLADLQASGTASPEEILSAQRAVEDQQRRVTDAADAQTRALLQQHSAARSVDQAEKDLQTTREKGTKKDQNVKDAQDALTTALEDYKNAQIQSKKDISDAENKVKDVQIKSAQAQKEAGQRLADAEKAQAKTIKDAQQSVADAHEQAAERINAARATINTKPPTSWLTSDVLTSTLQQFTGGMTDAQLAAKGFSKEQIKAIQLQAQTAQDAATKVKTLTQLLDTAKETAGSGWTQTWQIILGDFGEARTTFTELSNAVNGWINTSANARNKVLSDWKALGGRTVLISAIKSAFEDLITILKPIKEAFRDIFPAKTGKDLFELTQRFKDFADSLKASPEAVDNLKRTFRGLFALLDIGKQIVGGIFSVFGQLFGVVSKGGGGFLDLTGNIGDFLVSVDETLKKGDKLKNFFELIGHILSTPIALLTALRNALIALFGGVDEKSSEGISKSMGALGAALTPLQKILETISTAWSKFIASLGDAGKIFRPAMEEIVKFFEALGPAIGNAVSNMNFDAILAVIRTGLLGGLYLMFKKFLGKGSFADQIGGGLLGNISKAFEGLTGTLKAMQQNIKADTLMKIAIAVGILVAAVVAMSFIDEKALNKSVAALAFVFGELLGAMAILDKISSSAGFLKMPFITASMIAMGIAIDLLTLAVRALAGLSWEQLQKGIGGVASLLLILVTATKPLAANSAGMIQAGVGLMAIAVAMRLLAFAVAAFGGMDLTTLGKGLGSVAIALVAIGLAAKLFPPTMPLIGAGLIAVGIALKLISGTVEKLGGMNLATLAKGIGAIALALAGIGAAMQLMPLSMVATAAGLILVGIALQLIAKAVGTFGGMSIEKIAKGLGTLAGSLLILSAALYEMSGTLAGAAALGIAAAGLSLLAPALVAMGKQSWGQIIKGLVSLAAAMVVLGVAGLLLEPVAPALIALGAAMLLIGGGLALAGAGIALIGVGLSAIAVAGPVAIGVLIAALIKLVEAIPTVVVGLVTGLLTIVQKLADTAPQFVKAITTIIENLAEAIIRAAPKIGEAFVAIIEAALKTLKDAFPDLVAAGLSMLISLLDGINKNISKVVDTLVNIIVHFTGALADRISQIVGAGAGLLVAFLKGIADNLSRIVGAVVDIVAKFVTAIADNLYKIVSAGTSIITSIIKAITDQYVKIIAAGTDAIINFIKGITDSADKLIKAGTDAAKKFMDAVVTGLLGLIDAGGNAIVRFLNGLAAWIKENEWQIIAAGAKVGWAVIQGIYNGLSNNAKKVYDFVKKMAKKVLHSVTHLFGIFSPSRVFYDIGENLMLGLAYGIDDHSDKAVGSVEDMAGNVLDSMNKVPDMLDGLVDMEPVIAPVLDLTAVEAGAKQIDGMINTVPPIPVATTSTGQASAISTDQTAQVPATGDSTPVGAQIKFEQNNYSPEALSEVEIYRQTKNQISQLQTALA
jgi:tape measure domain-containing protein